MGGQPFGDLLQTIAELRAHCPWMGALTHESLVEYLLEEAHEVAETIEADGGDAELQAELGDVLLQVVLHARLAEERGAFTFDDVARGLRDKIIRRNPHVFRPDGTLQDSFPAAVQEIVLKWDAVSRASPNGATPSTGSRPRCRPWPGRRSCWTGLNAPDFRQGRRRPRRPPASAPRPPRRRRCPGNPGPGDRGGAR